MAISIDSLMSETKRGASSGLSSSITKMNFNAKFGEDDDKDKTTAKDYEAAQGSAEAAESGDDATSTLQRNIQETLSVQDSVVTDEQAYTDSAISAASDNSLAQSDQSMESVSSFLDEGFLESLFSALG